MTGLDPARRPGEFVVVATAAGTSCNVLAGLHHDHLLVPAGRADEAVEVLRGLRW